MEHQDHWAALGRRVRHMGPPQVPGPDLARQIAGLCDGARGLTVLLGVTPAYADLGDRVLAFDGTPGMITAIWPGDDARRQAALADWTALPLADGLAVQVIGDGSLNALPSREILAQVLREMRRVLAPGGRAAVRVFTRPMPALTPEQVLTAARAGKAQSLNQLRWQLAAALARPPEHRVAVADILTASEALGDLAQFAVAQGMDPAQAEHLLAYRGSPARYVFPDRAALAADAVRAGLSCQWVETAGYPGADTCPIALFRPIA